MNADPNTGYIVYYTSDVTGFSVLNYWGGTSFVAPQLNAITSLMVQGLGHRIGLLNVRLYEIASQGYGAQGPRCEPSRRGITGTTARTQATTRLRASASQTSRIYSIG